MKENTKLILVAIIAVVVSSTISITATTMIQANSVSYKTENGETTVDNALNALFGLADVNVRYNEETDYVQIYYNNSWKNWKKANMILDGYLYKSGNQCNNITGGWGLNSYTYVGSSSVSQGSILDSSMTISSSGTANASILGTLNKIDLTGYNTLKVNVTAVGSATKSNLHIEVLSGRDVVSDVVTNTTVGDTTGEYSVDISNLNDEYYIVLYNYNSTTRSASVDKIWLE